MKKFSLRYLLLGFFVLFTTQFAYAESGEGKEFDATEMIMHHVQDSHEWHFFTTTDENGKEHHVSMPLPIILYTYDRGIQIFSSANFHNEGKVYDGFVMDHEHIYYDNGSGQARTDGNGDKIAPIDLSITKNVVSMMIAMTILLVIFLSVAGAYKKREGQAPKGLQSFIEPLVVFIKDDIAVPNIGEKKYAKYLPYLLTVFFFVWVNNLLGLIPTGANASGSISFTFTLAAITGLIVNLSGNKTYWGHIFAPPVPPLLWIIMIPVEILGIISKPFALMIRLFANITAGHIIILSLLSFIFIFKSVFVGIPVSIFVVIMNFLELFVAFLQAYVFTLLSALYIGLATEEHHHEHEVEHHK